MLFGSASQCSEIASPPHCSAENQLVILATMEVHGLFNHFQLLALPIFYNLCPFSVIKVHRKLEEDDTDISQTKSMLADGPWTNLYKLW
ncbi:hypothetical protein GOBAR_DD24795 [Gossypium barbadense]|nr:hypothetical protein GOBAR_DD24795 [Gossypium barbadense]